MSPTPNSQSRLPHVPLRPADSHGVNSPGPLVGVPALDRTTRRPVRVLIVDDSVVIRRLVTDVLQAEPDIEVVGTAVNGRLGLTRLAALNPDIVTLDIEMPELDGIGMLKELRKAHHRVPVIMFSTLTERGAASTLEALTAGASDYVTKPANMGSVAESLASVRDQLVPKIRALTGRRPIPTGGIAGPVAGRPPLGTAAAAPKIVRHQRTTPPLQPRVLAIGCSTGGPQALTALLTSLPKSFPLPIVVVQHMPPVFTAQFAARLDRSCAVGVSEAVEGQPLEPGHVLLAPGDHHLEVRRQGASLVAHLHQGPQVAFCRPAVDVLFRSVAAVFGGEVLAVVLTGMGQDGRDGCADISHKGGAVIVQDQATSVVWGMPGAVASAGLADEILPLAEIGPAITRHVGQSASRSTVQTGSP